MATITPAVYARPRARRLFLPTRRTATRLVGILVALALLTLAPTASLAIAVAGALGDLGQHLTLTGAWLTVLAAVAFSSCLAVGWQADDRDRERYDVR